MRSKKARDELQQHTPEQFLLDTARRLARFREGRRALHIHLSRLKPYSRRERHIRMAVDTFERLVKPFGGSIFHLSNCDIVFVCKDVRLEAIQEAVMRLRYLFSEDPLAHEVNDETSGGFYSCYSLEHHYDEFLRIVTALHEEAGKGTKSADEGTKSTPKSRPRIDGRQLSELVDAIQYADLSNLLRRQPIAAMVPGAKPHVVFREFYISIADLRDTVLPGFEIAADRWLFQHLTETLDRRMLKLLINNNDDFLRSSFSINMNVASLLSDDFLQFDATLRAAARGTILLEFQLVDIFADISAYVFAREFAAERKYRICLDGISYNALPYVDRARLGADFVKVRWRPEMADLNGERMEELKALISRLGRTGAILCHVDGEEAVRVGHSCGFALFQGRYIDHLLSENSPKAVPAAFSKARPY